MMATEKVTENRYVVDLQHIDSSNAGIAGAKAANLGVLSRLDGIRVPAGFCVCTSAFTRVMEDAPAVRALLHQLSQLQPADRAKIRELSAGIRRGIEGVAIPEVIEKEITRFHAQLGGQDAYAVRSSATAEDLPTASFAGQQDSFLNVIGKESILNHISRCWASLFTERAVTYRMQHGFDHRTVQLAVIVQKMVFPQVAGIMFTADPVTGNRKVVSIEASFGLGEALVAGLVNADVYKVRNGDVISKTVSTKKLAIHAVKDGGTGEQAIAPEWQNRQALTDRHIGQLARIGRQIEAHFGCPQDIEWCLADEIVYIVQSRPITTLYPIPEAADGENHVYVSVGHQQMMTDAMKPLGLSFFLLTTPAPMRTAGGRLFVDVTSRLASPLSRQAVIDRLGQSDPLIKDALTTLINRGDFVPSQPAETAIQPPPGLPATARSPAETSPAAVAELIQHRQAALETVRQTIQAKSGTALFEFILADIQQLKKELFDSGSLGVIDEAMQATYWLNENMQAWLGEKAVADTLSQSVPNNVTSEMGLALLDVADAIRPYPAVIAYLQRAGQAQLTDAGFWDNLPALEGGRETRAAIRAFLDRYGMRCVGEIDITRPRWSETPRTLVALILSNIINQAPGASQRKFEQGRQAALTKEQDLLNRLSALPDGDWKADETKRRIDLLRNFIGYREYPKYSMVSRYAVYRQALLREADQLVLTGVIHEREDIYFLSFGELREAVRTQSVDDGLIRTRKEEYKTFEKLTPPRVMTSDGEIITGAYRRENLPPGTLAGLPVSAGLIEGRARVILRIEDANLEDDDILVTTFTDPSWTPLFVAIKGLITEVGGLMTHGAVIAREYGLPAVIGVENATRLIRDGQRIRLHGTDGYVELL